MQRRLGKVLTEELSWPAMALPEWIGSGGIRLRVATVSSRRGLVAAGVQTRPGQPPAEGRHRSAPSGEIIP